MSVKETEEAVVAVGELYKEVKLLGSNGFQWTDVGALLDKMKDPAFAAKLGAGLQGFNLIGAELSHMGWLDALELVRVINAEFRGA